MRVTVNRSVWPGLLVSALIAFGVNTSFAEDNVDKEAEKGELGRTTASTGEVAPDQTPITGSIEDIVKTLKNLGFTESEIEMALLYIFESKRGEANKTVIRILKILEDHERRIRELEAENGT